MRSGPTLFSISFSIMLCEAKEDLPDSIYICFRTDSSLFNLRHLLTGTKTIEELITELLFADHCALLTHTEEALQHITNCLSDAAKNFSITIGLKKTEVLYQPPPFVATGIQSSAEETACTAGISHQSWQQEASDRDSWYSSVRRASCEFKAERHKAKNEKR